MAVLTSGLATVNLIDFSGETQEHSFGVTTPSAGNFAAQEALYDAYVAALLSITGLNVLRKNWGKQARTSPADLPLAADAQREKQWLVQYVDNTTNQRATLRVGGAIYTGNLLARSDHADLTATDIAAYKAAFEAFAKSISGNAVTINDIVVVGKNDRRPNVP
jgi:phosphopantetheinyl transferase (holo-ACP synthase)